MIRKSFSTVLKLLFAVCAFSLTSCQEFEINSQGTFPPKMEVDAQPEYTVLAKSPRAIVFNVSSNTPWTITSDQNWCIPTPALSSAGSLVAEITVNVEENVLEKNRIANLTITAEGIDTPVKVIIKQDAKGKLAVQPVDDPLPSEGGTATFTINSNKAWTVTSSNQWLTFSKEDGTGTGEKETITVIASANSGMRRTATVTVSNGLDETTFEVIQNGIILAFVELDETPFDGNQDKETKRYEVLSNIDWEVSTDAEWLEVTKNGDGIIATTQSEVYFTTRTAHIMLTAADKTLSLEPTVLEVKQAGGTYIFNGLGCSANETTGAVSFDEPTGNGNSRYYINKRRKLAIHEWTFSDIEVVDNRCLNMNCVEPPIPSWNFWLGTGANPWTFKYRGGTMNSNTVCEPFDVNSLKALKVENNYVDPSDRTKMNIKIYIKLEGNTEWKKIIETPTYDNLFETSGSQGNLPYFGFTGGSAGKAGKMTITSYSVTNIE